MVSEVFYFLFYNNYLVYVYNVIQYSLPACYILRVFVNLRNKTPKYTIKRATIPALLHFFETVREWVQ